MSALAYQSVAENQNAQVANNMTNISANARIDYILRFSKQTIFVVDEQAEQYTPITSQFLATLNSDHNAAFIAISAQLHDIQIRSRIVEQLFTNVLFDPEQSLALSLINLAKASPQKISIAIEHGQFLSTQLLHELTQLSEVAKKAKLTIDVVISGSYLLGHQLSENMILFKGKVSILSASNGQLLPLKSSLFKQRKNWIKPWLNKKTTMVCLVLAIFFVLSAVIYQEVLSSTNINTTAPILVPLTKGPEVFVKIQSVQDDNQANNIDILNALSFMNVDLEPPKMANSFDILNALSMHDVLPELNSTTKTLSKDESIVTTEQKEISHSNNIVSYDQFESGFVIQYAAFSDPTVKNDFLAQFPELDYLSYFRLINDTKFEVLTSQPYADRASVEQAKTHMDESLIKLNIWIKSLSIIKSEIKHYQSSQSGLKLATILP